MVILYHIIYCVVFSDNCFQPDDGQKLYWPNRLLTCYVYFFCFYNLLPVYLSIFISVINQHDAQRFCFTISLFHASTCFEHKEVKIALHSLWYHHTYSCDDTRGCVMQLWPHDDEYMCSKHVEAWNKLIVKQQFCASGWLITEIKCCTIDNIVVLWQSCPCIIVCLYFN